VTEPLKALADKVWFDTRLKVTSPASYSSYLFDDLRVDEALLSEKINKVKLSEIGNTYNTRKINLLIDFLVKRFSEKL
jgi:hypothetical protein